MARRGKGPGLAKRAQFRRRDKSVDRPPLARIRTGLKKLPVVCCQCWLRSERNSQPATSNDARHIMSDAAAAKPGSFRDLLYADQGMVWMTSMTMGSGPEANQPPWSLFRKAAEHVRAHDRNLAV